MKTIKIGIQRIKIKPQSSNGTTVTIFYKSQHYAHSLHFATPPPPKKNPENIYLFILPRITKSDPLKSSNTEFWWSIQCSPTEGTI